MGKIISIYLEDYKETIFELDGKPDNDIGGKLVLIIAGTNKEYLDYRNTHNKKFNADSRSKDHLVNVIELGDHLNGIEADYIKVIGTAMKRPDYVKILEACKLRLR
jgi:hypothetical protein